MAAINNARKVKVQQRSGFDKSFRNTLTGNVGTLIPILVDELIPDTKVNLKINLATALPPLVSDTYMNVRLRVEAFVVPHRLCQANFEDFFSDYPAQVNDELVSPTSMVELKGCMPLMKLNSVDHPDFLKTKTGAGSLTDYMGIETRPADAYGEFGKDIVVPLAPYIAYHLIWQEWYRNPRVQNSAFRPSIEASVFFGSDYISVLSAPFSRFYFDNDLGTQPTVDYDEDSANPLVRYQLCDDKMITDLRQRNFGLDYFTSAMVEPQQGDVAVVKFGENGDPQDGFSIASLRAMNSIQQFRERNGLTSPRYQQQLYARYGVAPSDGVIQRPVLIGAATYDVYSHGVTQTSSSSEASGNNPFRDLLGARGGNAFAGGSDFIISGFHAKEPMYLIVLASLVPEVSYSQNLNMIFRRYKGIGSITDMGNAILQNVGPQPITNDMISVRGVPQAVFAYADRYSDFMYRNNEIHGEFKYGRTLASFVLQRFFATSVPEFGSQFLTIPTNYLDDVLAVRSDNLGFAYWADIMFEYHVSMPLQEYAIPSLQDPGYEHGKTIVLRKNGQLL